MRPCVARLPGAGVERGDRTAEREHTACASRSRSGRCASMLCACRAREEVALRARSGNTRRSGSRQKKSRSFRRSYSRDREPRVARSSHSSTFFPPGRGGSVLCGLVIARSLPRGACVARARRGRHCITAVMSRAFSDAATVEVGSGPSIDCGAGHTETTCAFECNWCLEKQICADSWQACQLPATPARWPWLTILLFCIACGCMYLFAQRRLRHPVVASDASSGVVHESRAYESYELDELDALPAATAPSPSQLQPEGQRLLGV